MLDALLTNAALLAGAMALLWLLGVVLRSVSFIDAVWGFSMAGLAVGAWLMARPGLIALLLMVMTAAWGLRLGVHLLRRYLRHGEDPRYRKMLPDPENRAAYALTAFWKVFLLQGVLVMLVSSPAQVGILAAHGTSLDLVGWLGMALYGLGMVFEIVGDRQLAQFKRDPANAGKVMDKGLWRYTRHPNYFGDACVWWGIWLLAINAASHAVIWTLPGPLFLTFTLVKWSGAAMTENAMRAKYGEAFVDYTKRTSAFVPWKPKP